MLMAIQRREMNWKERETIRFCSVKGWVKIFTVYALRLHPYNQYSTHISIIYGWKSKINKWILNRASCLKGEHIFIFVLCSWRILQSSRYTGISRYNYWSKMKKNKLSTRGKCKSRCFSITISIEIIEINVGSIENWKKILHVDQPYHQRQRKNIETSKRRV